ncbi:MAG: PEGA domain-containing protein [Planctomycetota bacterium]
MRAAGALLLLFFLAGCVERRLWVRTDPPGAVVRINGADVGRAPVSWRFDHYGTVLVEAELAGHRPAQQAFELRTPWYQRPVVDFFADVVWPGKIKDDHELALRLEPERPLTPAEIEAGIREVRAGAAKLHAEAEKE